MAKPNARRAHKSETKNVIRHWDNPDYLDSNTMNSLISTAAIELNTPFSLAVYCLLSDDTPVSNIELLRLCDELRPEHYLTSTAYRRDNLLRNLLSYNPCLQTDLDLDKEAMKKFVAGEISCRRYNREIFEYQHLVDSDVVSVLHYATKRFAKTISDLPDPADSNTKFGPGSSYSIKKNTSALDKLSGQLECTARSIPVVLSYLRNNPGWWRRHFDALPSDERLLEMLTVIPGDRSECVPKNATANRLIKVGPLLTVIIQKMYGKSIGLDLQRCGIGIKTGQSKHRYLAKQASINGINATVDVKNASGTICTALYHDLLPPHIFEQLDAVRSTKYSHDDQWYEYEMFSGMGNGYTFELETMLFYVLSRSVMDHMGVVGTCSVYGDDIILPAVCAPMLAKVFKAVGLTMNAKKSFVEGPFRESCGGDFFLGDDVNTFKLREALSPRLIVLWHNRWLKDGDNYHLPKTFQKLRKILPKGAVNYLQGPWDGGDGHFHDYRWPEGKPFGTATCTTEFHNDYKPDLTRWSLESFALYRVAQTSRSDVPRCFRHRIRGGKVLLAALRYQALEVPIQTKYEGEIDHSFKTKHGFMKYKLSPGITTRPNDRLQKSRDSHIRDVFQHCD